MGADLRPGALILGARKEDHPIPPDFAREELTNEPAERENGRGMRLSAAQRSDRAPAREALDREHIDARGEGEIMEELGAPFPGAEHQHPGPDRSGAGPPRGEEGLSPTPPGSAGPYLSAEVRPAREPLGGDQGLGVAPGEGSEGGAGSAREAAPPARPRAAKDLNPCARGMHPAPIPDLARPLRVELGGDHPDLL